jgi:hypothetical protein
MLDHARLNIVYAVGDYSLLADYDSDWVADNSDDSVDE